MEKASEQSKNCNKNLTNLFGTLRHLQIYKEIADSGVKIIIAGSTVGELAMHYLDRHQSAVLKVLSKFDLRRLCRCRERDAIGAHGTSYPRRGWLR